MRRLLSNARHLVFDMIKQSHSYRSSLVTTSFVSLFVGHSSAVDPSVHHPSAIDNLPAIDVQYSRDVIVVFLGTSIACIVLNTHVNLMHPFNCVHHVTWMSSKESSYYSAIILITSLVTQCNKRLFDEVPMHPVCIGVNTIEECTRCVPSISITLRGIL